MVLKESKLVMTPQRLVIIEELSKVKCHPSADEIYEMVRKRLPRISLGTVYRNLEILSEHGIVKKLNISASQKRYDANTLPHYHLRCVSCEKIDDIPIEPDARIEVAVRESSNYQILGHNLEVIGLCPDCKSKCEAILNNNAEIAAESLVNSDG